MKKLILIFVVALISSNLIKAQNLNATISSSTNVSCFGGNNGSATVIATGGTSPYSFMWNTVPQQTTATAINLTAGSYTVTVTDAVSNTSTVNVIISQPNVMNAVVTSSNATCFGLNDGSIYISGATGGNGTYEYSINGGAVWQTSGIFSALSAGTYNISMRDVINLSCVTVLNNSLTITQPAQITVNAGLDQSVCHNGTATLSGSVTVATGAAWTTSGTGTFNPNNTSLNAVYYPSAADNSSGTVTLTLTSTGNGTCAAASDAMILTLIPLPTITGTTPGSRCGVGSVTLGATASAGNIMWYYAMTGGTSLGLGGAYTTTALSTTTTFYVDATFSGCTSVSRTPVVATINYPPVATATPSLETICSGSSTNISLSSSAGGATFSWTANQSGVTGATSGNTNVITQILYNSGTTPGTAVYTITPTAAGCVGNNLDVTITVMPVPVVVANPDSQIICSGEYSNITLSSNISGTTFNWTVIQNGSNGTTAGSGNTISDMLSNLGTSAGTATYTITPTASSCSGSPFNAIVTVNPLPIINSATKTDVTICGGSDGTITVVATGDAPLIYSIDGGMTFAANSGLFTGLNQGNYPVTVKNSFGCIVNGVTLVVADGGAPPAPAAGTDAIYCQGQSLSDLSATAGNGGTLTWYSDPSLINVIGTGGTLVPFSTVGTQNYYITETVSGCESQSTVVTVTINPLPLVSAGTDQNICYGTSTTLTGNGSGTGTTYSWYPTTGLSSSVIVNPVATPVETTIYTLVVADANGCTGSDTVVVSVNLLPVVDAGNNVSICSGSSTVILATPVSGTLPFIYTWNNGASNASITVSPTILTVYTVTITDANGCLGTDSVTVNVNSLPTVTFSGLAFEYCRADTMVLLIGNYSTTGIFSGTGIIGNNVFNPINANTGSNQITYSYTDINGCTNSYIASTIINENPVLSATTTNASCNQNNGSAILSATGGTFPYIYQYPTGISTMNNLWAGAYTVVVIDNNGCKSASPVIIVNDGAPAISILSQVDAGCSISCDGAATIEITGGAEPYSINWSNGSSLLNPADLCVGENFVQITDMNNCITGAVVSIGFSQPDPTIFGRITYSGGNIDGQFANLEIYSISQNFGGGFDLMNSQVQVGSDGTFIMANFPPDMYILKVLLQGNNPAYSNLINSYYTITGTSYTWETADTIILNCGEYKEANIIMHEMLQTNIGSGIVSGTISYPGTGGSKNLIKGISISQGKLAGEPVPGAEIFVELEPDDEPIANTTTDTAGFYTFDELPEGGYSLQVEIPGFPMISTYTVTVSSTDTVFEGLNFFVDTTVNDGNIDTTFVFISNEDAPVLSVSVYPNPYTDIVTVAYKINNSGEISINVYDITGKIIASEPMKKKATGEYTFRLNANKYNMLPGAYFIQLKVDNNIYLKKVIKSK